MNTPTLPLCHDRWSLDSWFSGFGQPDYQSFKADLVRDIAAIQTDASTLGTDTEAIARVIGILEPLGDRIGHLSAFLGCLSADDSNDEAVKSDEAWIATLEAENVKLHASLCSALAAMEQPEFDSMIAQPALADAAHAVKQMRTQPGRVSANT